MKHNLVYKITNLINGNYYIGKHSTDNIDDEYMGSGKLIQKAINKYGIENFKKEILFDFLTEEEAYQKEKELMPLEKTHYYNNKCYNLVEGGEGGIMTDETKNKIRKTNQQYCGEKHSQYGKPKSTETKEKISKTVSEKTKGELNGMYGKKLKDCMSSEKYEEWCKKNGNCYWCNNGITETKIKNGQSMPEGFKTGRLKQTIEKTSLGNIGRKHSDESIKKGIQTRKQRGNLKRSKESIEKQKTTRLLKNISYATTTNCKWYNDGTNEKLFKMDEQIPNNWVPGRLKFKNYKWYNNGKISKRLDSSKPIPSGFVLGRLLNNK